MPPKETEIEMSKEYQVTNACLLDKINDLEINQKNLSDELQEVKEELSNQIRDFKSILMDAMHTLSKAFKMNCEGTLNLREEISEYAGTCGIHIV